MRNMYLKQWAGRLSSQLHYFSGLTSCVTRVKAIHLSEPQLLSAKDYCLSAAVGGVGEEKQGKAGGRFGWEAAEES